MKFGVKGKIGSFIFGSNIFNFLRIVNAFIVKIINFCWHQWCHFVYSKCIKISFFKFKIVKFISSGFKVIFIVFASPGKKACQEMPFLQDFLNADDQFTELYVSVCCHKLQYLMAHKKQQRRGNLWSVDFKEIGFRQAD